MARFAALKADADAPSVVFQKLCEGEALREIAKAWGLPKGRFAEWFTVEHAGLYDAALKVRADELAHEALSISDEQSLCVSESGKEFDPDVPRDKLRIDTRLKLASKWDRKRYGEEADAVRSTPVIFQIANLRGNIGVSAAGPVAVLPAPESAEAI